MVGSDSDYVFLIIIGACEVIGFLDAAGFVFLIFFVEFLLLFLYGLSLGSVGVHIQFCKAWTSFSALNFLTVDLCENLTWSLHVVLVTLRHLHIHSNGSTYAL